MNPQHIHGARGTFEQPGTVYVCDAGHGCELTGEGGAPGALAGAELAGVAVEDLVDPHGLALALGPHGPEGPQAVGRRVREGPHHVLADEHGDPEDRRQPLEARRRVHRVGDDRAVHALGLDRKSVV